MLRPDYFIDELIKEINYITIIINNLEDDES